MRLASTALVMARLAQAARRRPPVVVALAGGAVSTISVVIPARNEARRIGPLLRQLGADATATEVIVVDDESTDDTAALAGSLGARVVSGRPLPAGWVGKPWALDQGLRVARGEWVVTMDADAEAVLGLPAALVERAQRDGLDFVSLAGRFRCPTSALRWLHPSLLTTLVYRFGPPGSSRTPRPDRSVANGQCTAFRRRELLEAGGFRSVAGHLTEDVALVRYLAEQGWRTALLDGTEVFTVRMHDDARDAWTNWGRSLPMPDVTSPSRQAGDLVVLAVTQALPLPRLLLGRADALDMGLLALRAGTLVGTARAYERTGVAYWLSPVADAAAVARVAWGAVRPGRTWRDRTYPS